VTATEDDGGRVNEIRDREKLSLQDLYPPGRRGTGLPLEDDGVAPMTSAHIRIKPEEIIAAGPIPPTEARISAYWNQRSRLKGLWARWC
jgi:hypothetical protein